MWPLLAWLFGFGPFWIWSAAVGVPALALLAAAAAALARWAPQSRLRAALVVGTLGGLLGTIGYDLVRVPFTLLGLRLFAPIESYGVLILDRDSSSPVTDLAGWAFHFGNGIGFGIAYAIVALGRHWGWALLWAMALETATILTPFATTYGQSAGIIAIAYAAHVAYGLPLGVVVQRHAAIMAELRSIGRHAVTGAVALLVLVLLLWHRPLGTPDRVRAGEGVAPGPSALVVDGRLAPTWLRVAPGRCATLRNADRRAYRLRGPDGRPVLLPGATARVCFGASGVHRLRTSGEPYSGGFVIVDPAR